MKLKAALRSEETLMKITLKGMEPKNDDFEKDLQDLYEELDNLIYVLEMGAYIESQGVVIQSLDQQTEDFREYLQREWQRDIMNLMDRSSRKADRSSRKAEE